MLYSFAALFAASSLVQAAPPRRTVTPRILSAIRAAAQVETFRLRTLHVSAAGIETPGPETKMVDRWVVTKEGQTQGVSFAEKLASLLTEIQKFPAPQLKCGFEPGVAYQMKEAQGAIQVLFCFHCGEVRVTEEDKTGKKVNEAFLSFYGPRRQAAITLARAAFPDDIELSYLAP